MAAGRAAAVSTTLRARAAAPAPALSIADLSVTSGQLHSGLGGLTITMPVECSRSIRESLELPETRLPTMWGGRTRVAHLPTMWGGRRARAASSPGGDVQ